MMHKILTVDDEVEIVKIISAFLNKKGFQVLTAYSGEEALEVIAKEKPDLILLDKKMPGIGGRGVLKKLKEDGINIPVILLSGSLGMEEMKELVNGEVLSKPIDLNELVERVNKRLQNQ